MRKMELVEALYDEYYTCGQAITAPEVEADFQKVAARLKVSCQTSSEWLAAEDQLSSMTVQYERQGFINGFRCAAVLLLEELQCA